MLMKILTLNEWGERWMGAMSAVLWQSVVLVAMAALIAWSLRRSSPVVRYWLWQIVAIKLLLMPFWSLAAPLPSWTTSSPVSPLATSRRSEVPRDDSGRMPLQGPPQWAGDAGVETPLAGTPIREALATISWRAWLFSAWFAVVFWQFLRLPRQRSRLTRLLRHGTPADEDITGMVTDLAGQLGLRHVPTAVSVADDCPVLVFGIWRSWLVLPGQLMARLDQSRRRQVVLHELAHIKRRDLAWGWPVEIARIVYFFHPLVHWVAYQLALERELACDQLAMARGGHPPADYAQTLVEVVSHTSNSAAVQAAVAAGATGSQLRSRQTQQPNPS
ncbi:MAG: M56 family metallopeptidase [Planctomycetia bacterium]|nr:M56 family metallopeptidase [Planctomycetia bacterium]